MKLAEYVRLDALGIARLVRRGELAPHEPCELALAAIARGNDTLKAMRHSLEPRARAQLARGLDLSAPFAGVPFMAKDMLAEFAGQPSSHGSRARANWRAGQDSEIVTRWDAGGLVTVGITAMSEFGLAPITNPAFGGPACNPWNTAWNTGGSSGGSAAAVSAGWVPMAYAADGGGSIRIPASLCGLFGMRPSKGLNQWEKLENVWAGAVVTGVETRSVRDCAAYLDWIASRSTHYDPEHPPTNGLLAATRRPPPRLRIALSLRAWSNDPVSVNALLATRRMANQLSALGHEIVEAEPELDWMPLQRAFSALICDGTRAELEDIARLTGQPANRAQLELTTRYYASAAAAIGRPQLDAAHRCFNAAADTLRAFHERYPVWLTPVARFDRMAHGDWLPPAIEALGIRLMLATGLARAAYRNFIIDPTIRRDLGRIAFTPLANMTGAPSVSVPGYLSPDGMPVGALLSAAPGQDALLLSLAAQIEAAAPWAQDYPFLRDMDKPAGI